jgi:3-keto-disaccharide hydrolase
MKRLLLPFILAGGLLVGAHAGEKDQPKEPPVGFTSLFNGKDFTDWKSPESGWKVENGLIHYDGSKGAKNLVSAKNYKDFELWVDWKITKAGDSGIYLRGKPQVQIWDSTVLEDKLKEDRNKGSGGLWNNKPGSPGKVPFENKDKKVGDWNTFYIKMVGTQVTVILNGAIVVDNAIFLEGKIPADGPIELQVHNTPLWFRNIYVREIKK